jgi:crotonobetainyl-CoA:carnitine CoA-transferase CaiB-like acyl-CoA transferase
MRHVFADTKNVVAGNPTFAVDNRGKRAVVLDISKPEGRDALARLAASADVFLTNVRPAALKRAGLDEAALRKDNPRLVYAMVTGYGLEGPDAHLPGFDVTAFWARSGVARMHAPKGTDPFILRTGVGDHTTSMATVSAILAALYERSQTGLGRVVQTSLLPQASIRSPPTWQFSWLSAAWLQTDPGRTPSILWRTSTAVPTTTGSCSTPAAAGRTGRR